MKYEIDKIIHQAWFNKCPWYNTSICSRLHGSLFDDFRTHARTDIYNLIFYLVAHAKNNQIIQMNKEILGIG